MPEQACNAIIKIVPQKNRTNIVITTPVIPDINDLRWQNFNNSTSSPQAPSSGLKRI